MATGANRAGAQEAGPRLHRRLSPPQILAAGFVGLIVAGTFLLELPVSAEPGSRLSLVDAFFTATSAICVTGLIVVDTPTVFTPFGEAVILGLIQAGGLGYMTLSAMLVVALGKRLTLRERASLQEGLNMHSREGMVKFLRSVVKTSLAVEAAGALVLALWWWPEHGLARAAWLGGFHAVSAFNNAGFSLFSDSLVRYRGDLVVNLVITGLIIAGGLGFFVVRELRDLALRVWRGEHRRGGLNRLLGHLTIHTKLALSLTIILLVAAFLAFLALEWRNPRTLGPLGWYESMLAAWFAAVTPRTAGFNTLDVGGMTVPAVFLTIVLMFIGANPGGTGGGVKTTTFGVTVLALWATVRGEAEPVVFRRRIAADVVARAFFISLLAFLALNLVTAAVLVVEEQDLMKTLFEVTSAFGTVGMSMGHSGSVLSLAGHFSDAGKLLLVLMMYLGRVGPLTVAVALAGRREHTHVRYPEGKVMIG
jgi:trk system potassium uptake protein TrkH